MRPPKGPCLQVQRVQDRENTYNIVWVYGPRDVPREIPVRDVIMEERGNIVVTRGLVLRPVATLVRVPLITFLIEMGRRR